MPTLVAILLALVLVCFTAYGLVNGMRDAPNAIALPVRARALTPAAALALAAVMNLFGGVLSGGFIAAAWQVLPAEVSEGGAGLIVAGTGLLVSVVWGLFAWARGVPVSMTHGLLAGLLGASAALTVTGDLRLDAVWSQDMITLVLLGLGLSPLLAWFASWVLVTPATWIGRDSAPGTVNHGARMVLAVTGAANALGHGVQSGQRMTFALLIALAAAGIPEAVGWWLPVACGLLLAVGTLFGGWRIAHTITERIVVLDPLRAGVASLVSAVLLFVGAYALALPLSSSHTTVAAVVGAGHNQPYTSVRWPHVLRIVLYWLATLVVCAAVGLILAAAVSPLL